MDFDKLLIRYQSFGGLRLIREYAKLGVLPIAVRGFVKCLVKGESFKEMYPKVLHKVEPILVAKYSSIMSSKRKEIIDEGYKHWYPKVVWWCWLQGIEGAPPIVKACYNSIKRHIPCREIKVVDERNWSEYVELPGYIVEKWEKGRIPAAMFSDLLRVELLIEYGGTWIDSTVLCTGIITQIPQMAQKYFDAELFLFQYTKEKSVPVSISNWFITARRNNEVLRVLREMLYAYWKDYDCVLDYYIFHLFFAMISKEYPEQMLAMPYGRSQNSISLMYNWGKRFDQEKWDNLTANVCFHKLSHRVEDSVKNDKDNYYNAIIKLYG